MKFDYQDGINDLQQSLLFLYPNPSFDEICIETSENQNHSELSILNLDGQELITSQITEPKTQPDISSLPSGIYFVRVTGVRTVRAGKFVKRKEVTGNTFLNLCKKTVPQGLVLR